MKRTVLISLVGIGLLISAWSCSSYKAMNQPDKKDLDSILVTGSDRDLVRAELGQPISYGKDNEGNETEVYSFVDGYHTSTKVSRAMFHFAADVFTIGLWEFVGNPVEGAYKGDKMVVRVTYKNSRVSNVEYLSVPASNASNQGEATKSDIAK